MSVPATRAEKAAGTRAAGLFGDHARLVLGLCRAILRDECEAEDAAQQTFLSAYRALLAGTTPLNASAWLAAIARNECRARIRRRREGLALQPLSDEDGVASAGDDTADAASRRADLRDVSAAVAALPERQREAILLREFYGLSYEETAAAMQVSEPAVDSLLSRARKSLDRVRVLPGLAQSPLLVPESLREQLARLIPGFEAGSAAVGVSAGAGAAGLAAKLASIPLGAKAAAVTMAVVAVGAGAGPRALERGVSPAAERAAAAPRASPVLGRASMSAAPSHAPGAVVDERSGPGSHRRDADSEDSDRSSSSGPSDRSGPSASSGPGSDGGRAAVGGEDAGADVGGSSGPGKALDDEPARTPDEGGNPGRGGGGNPGPGGDPPDEEPAEPERGGNPGPGGGDPGSGNSGSPEGSGSGSDSGSDFGSGSGRGSGGPGSG